MTVLSPLLQQGIAHHRGGNLVAAEACYRQALESGEARGEASYLLAEIAFQQARFADAETLSRCTLAADPVHPNALLCLGRALLAQEHAAEAVAVLQILSRIAPQWPAAWECLGLASQLGGLLEDAEEAYCRFVENDADNPAAWQRLAGLYLDCGHAGQAAAILEQALARLPDHSELSRLLGDAYRRSGDSEAARASYRVAIHGQQNGALAITEAITLPDFYHSTDHLLETRQRMESRLAELEDFRFPPCPDPVAAGGKNNFYSVYQGFDDRPLQEQLARLWRRIYVPAWNEAPPRPPGRQRIKVGFVSAHFRRHTVGDLFSGLIAGLPRTDFETVVFHLGEQRDDLTNRLAARVDAFHMPRSNDLRRLADRIAAEACDVLIYPDIGMEPLTYFLAFNRLAPVQAVSWGHPLTTGLDSIDYYISGDLQEPADGQRYYSEVLLRLPALPACLDNDFPAVSGAAWRQRLGQGGGRLYGIVQSLFKMHPDFDRTIVDLLEYDPQGRIVLVADRTNRLAPLLRSRINPLLGAAANRLLVVPSLGFTEYIDLLAAFDLSLDTQPFGGGKTAIDAAIIGTPVACSIGTRLAGRTAQALSTQFDLGWPVAKTAEEIASMAAAANPRRSPLDKAIMERENTRAIAAWVGAIQSMHEQATSTRP